MDWTEIEKAHERIKDLTYNAKNSEELHSRQLAAISTAALMNTRETMEEGVIDKRNPVWTPAYYDVHCAVIREIENRERIDEVSDERDKLAAELAAARAEVAKLSKAEELHGMQLAAISAASLANTRASAANKPVPKTNPVWTHAYEEVRTAVRREMENRERRNEAYAECVRLVNEIDDLKSKASAVMSGENAVTISNLRLHVSRLEAENAGLRFDVSKLSGEINSKVQGRATKPADDWVNPPCTDDYMDTVPEGMQLVQRTVDDMPVKPFWVRNNAGGEVRLWTYEMAQGALDTARGHGWEFSCVRNGKWRKFTKLVPVS